MAHAEIVKELKAARTFVGQAQEKATHLSDLWHILGKLYDKVDDEISMLEENSYSEEGQLVD